MKTIITIIIFILVSCFGLAKINFSSMESLANNPEKQQKQQSPLTENEKRFQEIVHYAIAHNLPKATMGQIMQDTAAQFLGAEYQAGLLDQNQKETLFISFTQFDCVLFVETVLAISRNIAVQDYQYQSFTNHIVNQRYLNGKLQDYCSRLHYFSEWIDDNQKRGNVKNITQDLGGISSKKTLDFMSNHRSSYPQLVNDVEYKCILNKEKSLQDFNFIYIPTNQIKSVYAKLQPGDIIGVATNILGLDFTHTGLVYLDTKGNTGIIHASPAGQVTIANDLQRYVSKIDHSIGIVVVRAKDPRQVIGKI